MVPNFIILVDWTQTDDFGTIKDGELSSSKFLSVWYYLWYRYWGYTNGTFHYIRRLDSNLFFCTIKDGEFSSGKFIRAWYYFIVPVLKVHEWNKFHDIRRLDLN